MVRSAKPGEPPSLTSSGYGGVPEGASVLSHFADSSYVAMIPNLRKIWSRIRPASQREI